MRLLATLLAVAVFTEAQSVLLRDEPRSKLTEVKEELQEYMRNINSAVNAKLILMRQSELGQQLERYIQDNVVLVRRRWNKLQNELPSEVAEAYNLAGTVPIAVALKTYATLKELRDELMPAVEELYDHLHPILAPPIAPVLKMVRAHANILGARVQELDTNLNQMLTSHLEMLATWLVPYAKSLRGQWKELHKSLQPFTNQAMEWLELGVEATEGSWKPYVAPVQKELTQYARVLYDLFIRVE